MLTFRRYDKITSKDCGMIFTTGAQNIKSPSVPDLQSLRAKFGDDLWTGMLEAEFSTRERVAFLFSRGTPICVYRLDVTNIQKQDVKQEWNALIEQLPSELAFTTLNISALRLVRILLEHPAPVETQRVSSDRLDAIFDQWHQSPNPNLAVMRWVDSHGFSMLWPGVTVPPTSVLVSSGGASDDSDAVRSILSSELGECDLDRHEFASDGGAWDEYGFQYVFVRLLGAILERYKELTGLALLNALDRNINRVAHENKWDFSITLGAITDHLFFCDLDETIGVCKTLLQVACDHIGVILGQKLSRSMVQDAIASLDMHSIRIIEKYSIDAFLGSPRTVTYAGERSNA